MPQDRYDASEHNNALSLAVLAFAVDDIKARESVTTSASPFAFLQLIHSDTPSEQSSTKRTTHF